MPSEKHRIADQEYYKKNKEVIKEKSAKWYRENREKAKKRIANYISFLLKNQYVDLFYSCLIPLSLPRL